MRGKITGNGTKEKESGQPAKPVTGWRKEDGRDALASDGKMPPLDKNSDNDLRQKVDGQKKSEKEKEVGKPAQEE